MPKTFKLNNVAKPDQLREELKKLFPDVQIEEGSDWTVTVGLEYWKMPNIHALQRLRQPGYLFDDLVVPKEGESSER